MQNNMITSEQQYIDLYEQAGEMIKSHSAEVMNAVRDEAFRDFQRLGFPSKKVERYKYTDIASLFAPDYGLNLNRLEIPVDPYEAFRCDVPNLSTNLYFVINDSFYRSDKREVKNNSSLITYHSSLPEGVIISSMREHPEIVERYYAKLAKTAEDGVTALNTMLAQDGMLVYVPKDVKVERAIQVINILKATPRNAQRQVNDLMVNRRVLIVLEQGAEMKMLFCDHAADDCNFLATQVIEAYVGDNARLDLYCLEETHYKNVRVSNVYIEQQRNSRVRHNVITLHNGITRNKLDLSLAGEGAECECFGCVIADKEQHVDNNTLITHNVPHCTSNELYKYVLDDKATGASEDIIADDEPEPLCLEDRPHVYPADAGNLCRRREVCPWFHCGAVERCGTVLYAAARHFGQGGQAASGVCLHQRGYRPDGTRSPARPSALSCGAAFPRTALEV